MDRLAGRYDPERGKIINPIKNMRAGDVTDAFATFIHEIQHVHLNYFTVIGEVTEILQKEKLCTPTTDRAHYQKIQKVIGILEHAVSELQEMYANSQELLWIEEYQGAEEADRVYHRKSALYQRYSRQFLEITDKCGAPEEKRTIIHEICVKAASPSMSADAFMELLMEPERLEEYFAKEGNVNWRLERLMEKYRNQTAEQMSKQTTEPEEHQIHLQELISLLIRKGICVYSAELLLFSRNLSDSLSEKSLKNLAENDYQDFLVKKMRGFDFSSAEESMKMVPFQWKEEYFSVIKYSSRLLYPDTNRMLMGWSRKEYYIGQEVAEDELREALKTAKALAIPFDEYDRRNSRPKYFKWENTPLFVILEDYNQCEQWMGEILEEDLYFVDLYPEDVQNFYTVLFFRRRKEPEVLFVFPTLKHLAEMLIRKWNLRNKILTSQNQESLKLFACFGDEIHMLQAITWLMSFVSGTGWNGSQVQQAASMLCVGFVRSLLESALQIRLKEYWNYRSSLPTMDTVSDGFYTFMEFEGRENTGIICAQEHGGSSYPVLFASVSAARAYAIRVPQGERRKLVAVDDCYWNVLRKHLKQSTEKWCLYLDGDEGILFDVEVYEQVRQMVKKRCF